MKQTVEFDFALGEPVLIIPLQTVGFVSQQVMDMGNKMYGVQYWAEGMKRTTPCMQHELLTAQKLVDKRQKPGFDETSTD